LAKGKADLEVFTISRSRVECDGMIELAMALDGMPSLKELGIHQNFIREKGMVALFNVLKKK